MSVVRLTTYTALASCWGSVGSAWLDNIIDGRLWAAIVNTAVLLTLLTLLTVMGRRDWKRGTVSWEPSRYGAASNGRSEPTEQSRDLR